MFQNIDHEDTLDTHEAAVERTTGAARHQSPCNRQWQHTQGGPTTPSAGHRNTTSTSAQSSINAVSLSIVSPLPVRSAATFLLQPLSLRCHHLPAISSSRQRQLPASTTGYRLNAPALANTIRFRWLRSARAQIFGTRVLQERNIMQSSPLYVHYGLKYGFLLNTPKDKKIWSATYNNKLVPWGTDGRLPLTVTLFPAIRYTVVHHSSTSTYVPNFIEIGRNFFLKVTTEVLVKFRVTWHKN